MRYRVLYIRGISLRLNLDKLEVDLLGLLAFVLCTEDKHFVPWHAQALLLGDLED